MSPNITVSIDGFAPLRLYPITSIEQSVFPGGEVYVRSSVFPPSARVTICSRVEGGDDLMRVIMLTDALRRNGNERIGLILPYMPYARQDRVCRIGEALSARVMADLLNAQNYDIVQSYDVHSDVIGGMINRFRPLGFSAHVHSAMEYHPDHAILIPDAGAARRVNGFVDNVRDSAYHPVFQALKFRKDCEVSVQVPDIPKGHPGVIIIDDICDGGRTFIELAAALRTKRPDIDVVLCVTHGIFSGGLKKLHDGGISRIYTTNTFSDRYYAKDDQTNLKKFDI